jgi:polyhydroxyalkanoate synthase subunit PhaC
MNQPVPLEWVTSFVQTNQALVQHLATALLSADGAHGADFQSYAQLAQVQQDYLQRMSAMLVNATLDGISNSLDPPKGDRRFGGEEWGKSPLHAILKDSYLINTPYVNDLIDRSGVDQKTRGRMRFFARQILDALSPSNYLATKSPIASACPGNGRRQCCRGHQKSD